MWSSIDIYKVVNDFKLNYKKLDLLAEKLTYSVFIMYVFGFVLGYIQSYTGCMWLVGFELTHLHVVIQAAVPTSSSK